MAGFSIPLSSMHCFNGRIGMNLQAPTTPAGDGKLNGLVEKIGAERDDDGFAGIHRGGKIGDLSMTFAGPPASGKV